ncbi:50S ribosomal protein L24e [Candidatus Woesearchaeota archaeon]|nr:50S ribosomal protein L24e [Candidatus Woesearchaeota archaeon]
MAICEFCGRILEKGTGKIYVYKTGKYIYLCSSKCENNLLKLGRNPKKFKWTLKRKKLVK